MIAHRWLLSSALWCVQAGAQTRSAGTWEEHSRIYAHKSDRCMVCHYPPLIITLPVLFILWATLAVLFRNVCTVTLWSDRYSWGGTRLLLRFLLWLFLCVQGLSLGILTVSVWVYLLTAECVHYHQVEWKGEVKAKLNFCPLISQSLDL